MPPAQATAAALSRPTPQALGLSGSWTTQGLGRIEAELEALQVAPQDRLEADAARIDGLDTAGAWLLHKLLARLKGDGIDASLHGLRPEFAALFAGVAAQFDERSTTAAAAPRPPPSALTRLGCAVLGGGAKLLAVLGFIGETAVALAGGIAQPARLRWRPILFNLRSAGLDALPIVGLLSFLLGIVVAYQGASTLRQYGANIFVVDLIGVSMLREFAPLITAIIVAGRSGSAYAAQIGTMAVTEEIDAMRTLGIAPLEVLVLPKLIALVIALPLLTVFADLMGVAGGMLMARMQLGVGYGDFVDRFAKAVGVSAYLVGLGKAPVFAAIIAVVGCYQGLRTRGGADSVGRQTTRSVVQAIFLVIVADALFSIAFSALDL